MFSEDDVSLSPPSTRDHVNLRINDYGEQESTLFLLRIPFHPRAAPASLFSARASSSRTSSSVVCEKSSYHNPTA
jgi:hypothetical protein